MIASPLLGALLGVLSKENGALIYPYLLVIEFTLLANTPLSVRMRQLRRWGLLIPLALGSIAFTLYLPSALTGYEIKPFSLLQRILTEPQALLTYLLHIGLPLPGNFGIYHDDFRIYQGVADLLWAISGILLIFAALAAAVICRPVVFRRARAGIHVSALGNLFRASQLLTLVWARFRVHRTGLELPLCL